MRRTIEQGCPVIDYPLEGETVTAGEYTMRVTAPPQASRVELSIDGGDWEPCRLTDGRWWYDWRSFREGPHDVIARCHGGNECPRLSEPRDFGVSFTCSLPAGEGARVGEVMSRGVESVRPGFTVKEAAERMLAVNIGVVPVIEDGRILGVLTDRDIVLRVVASGLDPAKTKVEQTMTRSPLLVHEDERIRDVARLMEARRIRRVPVLDKEDRPVGVLSFGDFTRRSEAKEMVAEVLEAVASRR